MTDYEKCVNVFHSEMKDKYVVSAELEEQWFSNALFEYGLDVYPLSFNWNSGNFYDVKPPIYEIGLLMTKYYCKQEISRINKLNNIVGKDLQLTGMGQAKSAIMKEYAQIISEIESKLHKHKQHAFS